jgi:hypothetical protein
VRLSVCPANKLQRAILTGADNFLAFPVSYFSAQPIQFFLDGLKKLEPQSDKWVELRGEYGE